MENEYRPIPFKNCYYQTGIQSTDFLFDVINFLAGYHELDLYNEKNQAKFLSCILCFTNFDNVLSINDNRIKEFLDHLTLRLFSVYDSRIHFPILIESGNHNYFNR